MKKTYLKPETALVMLKGACVMNNASTESAGGDQGTYNGNQLSRDCSDWDDEDY